MVIQTLHDCRGYFGQSQKVHQIPPESISTPHTCFLIPPPLSGLTATALLVAGGKVALGALQVSSEIMIYKDHIQFRKEQVVLKVEFILWQPEINF